MIEWRTLVLNLVEESPFHWLVVQPPALVCVGGGLPPVGCFGCREWVAGDLALSPHCGDPCRGVIYVIWF